MITSPNLFLVFLATFLLRASSTIFLRLRSIASFCILHFLIFHKNMINFIQTLYPKFFKNQKIFIDLKNQKENQLLTVLEIIKKDRFLWNRSFPLFAIIMLLYLFFQRQSLWILLHFVRIVLLSWIPLLKLIQNLLLFLLRLGCKALS